MAGTAPRRKAHQRNEREHAERASSEANPLGAPPVLDEAQRHLLRGDQVGKYIDNKVSSSVELGVNILNIMRHLAHQQDEVNRQLREELTALQASVRAQETSTREAFRELNAELAQQEPGGWRDEVNQGLKRHDAILEVLLQDRNAPRRGHRTPRKPDIPEEVFEGVLDYLVDEAPRKYNVGSLVANLEDEGLKFTPDHVKRALDYLVSIGDVDRVGKVGPGGKVGQFRYFVSEERAKELRAEADEDSSS